MSRVIHIMIYRVFKNKEFIKETEEKKEKLGVLFKVLLCNFALKRLEWCIPSKIY